MHLNELIASDSNLITLSNNMINEEDLSEFFHVLDRFSNAISKECLAVVMPFLCQYVYPPCDGNGSAQFITEEQCINIRDDVCKTEWKIAMATEQRNLLPVCETFGADNESSSVAVIREPLKCHYQFKEFCGVCLPLCGTFSQYSEQVKSVERAVIILAAVLALVSGFVIFIAAVMRPAKMYVRSQIHTYMHKFQESFSRLQFPQVLAIYTVSSAIMIGEISGL